MTATTAALRTAPEATLRDQAGDHDDPVVLSVSLPMGASEDPLALLQSLAEPDGFSFFWQRPADDFALVACGELLSVTGRGATRFTDVETRCRRIARNAIRQAASGPESPGPMFVGGFAFDPADPHEDMWRAFPAGRMVLPRAYFVRSAGSATLTVNTLVRGEASPRRLPPEDRSAAGGDSIANQCRENDGEQANIWCRAVAETVDDIRAGRIDKLVLARRRRVRHTRPIDRIRLLGTLRERYPECTIFQVDTAGGLFIGATPERLVALSDGAVRSAAIAGSTARGSTALEDRALAERLLHSPKERHEHALVARALAEALSPLCVNLDVAEEPTLLRLRNVQHLASPIAGRLRAPVSVLDLVARLHPSPAVGGFPADRARALLPRRESLDRGWYAGPVGWMDWRGDGDFAVAVRSALVRGPDATLYAGAGIVAGSDPAAELAETELKLHPLLTALRESSR